MNLDAVPVADGRYYAVDDIEIARCVHHVALLVGGHGYAACLEHIIRIYVKFFPLVLDAQKEFLAFSVPLLADDNVVEMACHKRDVNVIEIVYSEPLGYVELYTRNQMVQITASKVEICHPRTFEPWNDGVRV